MKTVSYLIVAGLLWSCAPRLSWDWADVNNMRVERPEFDKFGRRASAIVLLHEERYVMHVEPGRKPVTQKQVHRVVQVLTEGGLAYAGVKAWHEEKAKLVHFEARSVSPSGEVRQVQREELLETKATVDDEEKLSAKIMRVPQVEVGSIIEYIVTIEWPYWMHQLSGHMLEELPVERYRFELTAGKPVIYSIDIFNADVQLQSSEQQRTRQISFELRDLPAQPDESWEPGSKLWSPWWLFRVKSLRFTRFNQPGLASWEHAVEDLGKRVFDRDAEMFGDLDDKLDESGCSDKACLLDRAWSQVRDRLAFAGFQMPSAARPLDKVVASGFAHSVERNLYLWHLLDGAGVTAHLALVGRRYQRPLDKERPSRVWFNHLVLLLPAQDGLAQPLWLDATCAHCSPGQLSPWIRGTEALVIEHSPNPWGKPPVATHFAQPAGTDPPLNKERTIYRAQLAADGSASVRVEDASHGSDALWLHKRTRAWTDEDWRKDRESFATRRHSTARVTASSANTCDLAAGRCSREFSFSAPGLATSHGEQLVLPLSLFGPIWEGKFKEKYRAAPIAISDHDDVEEILELELPPGYEVAELPAALSQEAPGFHCTLEATAQAGKVRIKRRIWNDVGWYNKEHYDAMQTVLRAYNSGRNQAVVLRRTGAASAPNAAATTKTE